MFAMSLRFCLLLATGAWLSSARAAEDSAKEAQFLSNTRQLIYEGRRSGEGYFSADGKFLVFQSEREADNPFYQIYLLNLESGDINRVSTGTGKTISLQKLAESFSQMGVPVFLADVKGDLTPLERQMVRNLLHFGERDAGDGDVVGRMEVDGGVFRRRQLGNI